MLLNGPYFSSGGGILYFSDTNPRTISDCDYSAVSGVIFTGRSFVHPKTIRMVPDSAAYKKKLLFGRPDGIGCVSTDGNLIRQINLSTRHPSNVIFDCPGLALLYIALI